MKIKAMLALIFLLGALRPAASAEKMPIAVLDFGGKGATKAVAAKVSDQIRSDMVKSGLYAVMEKAQMNGTLKERGLKAAGCADEKCAADIGRALGVRKIVLGAVKKKGKGYVISGKIVDVEKAELECSEKAAAASKGKLNGTVNKLSEIFMSKIDTSAEELESPETGIKTDEDDEEIETAAGPVNADESNPYEWLATTTTYLSGAFLAGGTYMNVMISDLNDDISELKVKYNAATITAEAARLDHDIENKQDRVKSYRLYRNICFGTGGVFAVLTGFFAYKFKHSDNQIAESSGSFTAPLIMPVCWYNPYNNKNRDDVYYVGAGLTANF